MGGKQEAGDVGLRELAKAFMVPIGSGVSFVRWEDPPYTRCLPEMSPPAYDFIDGSRFYQRFWPEVWEAVTEAIEDARERKDKRCSFQVPYGAQGPQIWGSKLLGIPCADESADRATHVVNPLRLSAHPWLDMLRLACGNGWS